MLTHQMFHDESWKRICFGVKMSKVKVTSHKKPCQRESLYSCECWLLLVAKLRQYRRQSLAR